jgi:hypothetical protein
VADQALHHPLSQDVRALVNMLTDRSILAEKPDMSIKAFDGGFARVLQFNILH